MMQRGLTKTVGVVAAGMVAALTLSACSSSGTTGGQSSGSPSSGGQSSASNPSDGKKLNIAYMSFAVANSYDAPMLAAAKKVAAQSSANVTVFDANNSPQQQFNQMQNVISSGKYDGIITQPILATNLIPLVSQAVKKGIKVVNIDEVLGSNQSTNNPQVPGLSGNVILPPATIGQRLGEQVVAACKSKNFNPCNVGYLYDIKASTLDEARRKAFDQAIAGTSSVKVVAEGEDLFTIPGGLKAVQNMLQSRGDLNVIVGSGQGIRGGVDALKTANKSGQLLFVGYGGSAGALQLVAQGAQFADVYQNPATYGRLGMTALIEALRTGKDSGAINPEVGLPNGGIVTKQNFAQFKPEWQG